MVNIDELGAIPGARLACVRGSLVKYVILCSSYSTTNINTSARMENQNDFTGIFTHLNRHVGNFSRL